jgi:hypothetical protein
MVKWLVAAYIGYNIVLYASPELKVLALVLVMGLIGLFNNRSLSGAEKGNEK